MRNAPAKRRYSPAAIFSSEVAAPGRHMIAGGRAVAIRVVDGAFIGFDVPAGTTDVRLTYRPMSYWASVVVALIATVALIASRGP